MTLKSPRPRVIIFATIAIAIIGNSSLTARAGLKEAILTAYDGIEQSGNSLVFVAPRSGNNAGLQHMPRPRLNYDPRSGALSAEIPAVVIDTGIWGYGKLYGLSSLNIGLGDFDSEVRAWRHATYTWGAYLNLEPFFTQYDFHEGVVTWHAVDFDGAVTAPSIFGRRVVAATIDFGHVLPSRLSDVELRRYFSENAISSPYIDYVNHRGVVTLRVPMSLHVIPEPATVALLGMAAAFTRRYRCGPRCRWRGQCQ